MIYVTHDATAHIMRRKVRDVISWKYNMKKLFLIVNDLLPPFFPTHCDLLYICRSMMTMEKGGESRRSFRIIFIQGSLKIRDERLQHT